MSKFIGSCIVAAFFAVLILAIFFIAEFFLVIGSHIHTGEGAYSGIVVETRHHGVFWQTNGLHLKSGENSSVFEDFCVRDEALFQQLQNLPPQSKIEVQYRKSVSTPSWKCDAEDSDDMVIGFKVI